MTTAIDKKVCCEDKIANCMKNINLFTYEQKVKKKHMSLYY